MLPVLKNKCDVYSRAAVSCDNAEAAQIGYDILKKGGNAADAAVATATALNVAFPCMTGAGGDAFCIFYEAKTKSLHGLNGSGHSGEKVTTELIDKAIIEGELPESHGLTATVPGAVAAWIDTVERFGSRKLDMAAILQPAIDLAENGFVMTPLVAELWSDEKRKLIREANVHAKCFLTSGEGEIPKAGKIMKNRDLAKTFREIAAKGKAGFYEGRIAGAIVETVQKNGGVLTLSDLKKHRTSFEEPVGFQYNGVTLWEMPPNGQGVTAQAALNILKRLVQEWRIKKPA